MFAEQLAVVEQWLAANAPPAAPADGGEGGAGDAEDAGDTEAAADASELRKYGGQCARAHTHPHHTSRRALAGTSAFVRYAPVPCGSRSSQTRG